jgi:hypothetical protein
MSFRTHDGALFVALVSLTGLASIFVAVWFLVAAWALRWDTKHRVYPPPSETAPADAITLVRTIVETDTALTVELARISARSCPCVRALRRLAFRLAYPPSSRPAHQALLDAITDARSALRALDAEQPTQED